MNLNEEFPSRWLTGDEIDEPRVVTISEVEIVEFDSRERPGTKDRKVALHFRNEDKGMVCNVGMRKIVMGFYGPDTDDWIGKKIRIMASPFTSDKGETSMVCRIHPKKPEPPKSATGTPPKHEPADQDGANVDEGHTPGDKW
jgi:hypothetical protein